MTLRGMRFGRYDVAAFLGFSSYAACAMVAPVALVAVAEDLKFPLDRGGMSAGGMLHLGRSLAMVGTMLLCGFLAARWGMRRSVGYSLLLMGMATLCCALAPGYGWLLAATVAAGFGEGVFDGLISPFVRDLHREEEPGRYVNFTHGFWSFGVLTAVLVYGALLYWGLSWRGLFVLAVLVTLVPVLLLLLPESRGAAYPERREAVPASRIWAQSLEIMARPRFWLFFAAMLLAGGGEFCLTFWCATFIQMHFSASALAGGIGTAAFAAGMFLGRTGGGVLIRQNRLPLLVVGSAVFAVAASLPIPLLQPEAGKGTVLLLLLYGLLFVAGIGTAPFWPSIQSYAADRLPGTDTTMVFVLLSCAGIPGCGIFTWLMGVIGDWRGLRVSFFLAPLCFLVLGALIGWDWRRSILEKQVDF